LTLPEPARTTLAMAWTAAGAIEAAKRAFFRSFFRLLVAFVALAEWVCIAWVLLSVGLRPPRALHVLAPLAIFQLNRRIVMRRRSDRRRVLDALVRVYVAFAFTSIFCTLFLGLAGLGALAGCIVVPLFPATLGEPIARAYTWLVAAAFATLAGLRARHGVLVTLGNHDFYAGAETVTEALRRLTPFTVLRDGAVHLDVDGARLTVVGIDDLGRDWARGVLEHPALPSLAAAVPAGNLLIVLSHRPDCFAQAARLGAALMLSGHTHGGQLALPAWLGRRARNLAQFISRF